MNDSQTPPVVATASLLSATAVLKAAATLVDCDRTAPLLRKGLRFLLNHDAWPEAVSRLESLGLAVQHGQAPLNELLELPGELILLRREAGAYALLHRQQQRWLYLDANGEPLPLAVETDDATPLEAMVFTLPRSGGSFSSLAALWPELRAAWAEVGGASLFVNAGAVMLPMFAMLVYDKIALNGLFETLWALVIGMCIYLLTDTAMRQVRSWTTERISTSLTRRSDETLWSRLLAQVELPPGGFPRFISNYRDLTLSRDFVSSSYLLAIADIPFLLLYLAVIGTVSWPMMLVVLVLIAIYATGGLLLQRRQILLAKEAEIQNTQKLTFMGEALNNLDVVRTTPGAGSFLRSWRTLVDQSSRADAQRRLAMQHSGMFNSFMQTTTSVVVLTVGVYLIYAQRLSTGGLIACNLLAGRSMGLVASFYNVIAKWQDFTRSAGRMEKSLEPVDEHACTPRPEVLGQIAVLKIDKHYPERPPALDQVSFNVAPGERIALLGRPGAGKSTLLSCLAGLCRTDGGQIQVDGLDLEDIARFDRVRWLAYKGQDPAVFAGTLEDNLRISGCSDPERFKLALWASGLDTEFASGRMSLGMTLQERGCNLSGGQRQKVALARALAQPSRILLLDEPTLGLDPESERQFAERLPKLLDDSMVLVMTTHSPTMLQMVQRVIALEGGKVVADGPREKLVRMQAQPMRQAQAS